MTEDPLQQLIVSNDKLANLTIYRRPKANRRPKVISKKKSELSIEWYKRRANHYKRLWLSCYRQLSESQRLIARQEVMRLEDTTTKGTTHVKQ